MGTKDLANIVGEYIKNHEVLLMENHGAVAVGTTLLKAFDGMELLERAAVMNIISKQVEGSKLLNDEQIQDIIDMR